MDAMTRPALQSPIDISSFHPDGSPAAMEALRTAFLTQRRTQVHDALQQCRSLTEGSSGRLPDRVLAMIERLTASSALLIDDPVFAIWMRFFYRAWGKGSREDLLRHANGLGSVIEDVERRLGGDAQAYVRDSSIAVERELLHEYVRAATPPTYDFGSWTERSKAQGVNAPGHPLPMQADLLGYALQNIGQAWPGMLDQVCEHVRIFGYLPDASFRSCSAARYTGVVYLGNMDDSILDLEESIVHETGHQVLYRVGELEHLTAPDAPVSPDYVLPWSGSQRDLFGYLHAYYIYGLLVKYFWHRAQMGARDAMECHQRAGFILAGSLAAASELLQDDGLTPAGRGVVGAIADDLERLRPDLKSALGASSLVTNGIRRD